MSLIPLPYRILGGLLLLMAVFGGGYWAGSRNADNACVAGQAKQAKADVVAVAKEDTRREVIATAREVTHEQIRIVYRTIKEKADEYVKSNPQLNACGLDADGLRLWNNANSATAQSLSGQPDYTLHSTATSQVGQPGGLAGQSPGRDGAVQPVPGQAGQAGGVR